MPLTGATSRAPPSYSIPPSVGTLSERVFNPAVYEGHDGIRRFVAELDEVWDEFRIEPVEFIDAGDAVVV